MKKNEMDIVQLKKLILKKKNGLVTREVTEKKQTELATLKNKVKMNDQVKVAKKQAVVRKINQPKLEITKK